MLISWNSHLCSNGDILMQLLNWNTINFSVIYFWKNVENYNFCWKNEITVNLALKNPLNGQSKTTVANDIQYIYLQSICIFQNWVEGQTMWRIGRQWPFVFVKVRLKSQIWRCLSCGLGVWSTFLGPCFFMCTLGIVIHYVVLRGLNAVNICSCKNTYWGTIMCLTLF